MADRLLVWSVEMKGRLANAVLDFKRFNRTGDEKRNSFKTQEWSDTIKRYNNDTSWTSRTSRTSGSFRRDDCWMTDESSSIVQHNIW